MLHVSTASQLRRPNLHRVPILLPLLVLLVTGFRPPPRSNLAQSHLQTMSVPIRQLSASFVDMYAINRSIDRSIVIRAAARVDRHRVPIDSMRAETRNRQGNSCAQKIGRYIIMRAAIWTTSSENIERMQ